MNRFATNDRVVVDAIPGNSDREYHDLIGTVIEITKPHGYVRVRLDRGETILLHPESLSDCAR